MGRRYFNTKAIPVKLRITFDNINSSDHSGNLNVDNYDIVVHPMDG